jgi:hypothetical protein
MGLVHKAGVMFLLERGIGDMKKLSRGFNGCFIFVCFSFYVAYCV